MTAGVAESLARLRLVQGDSADQVRELAPRQGQLTLTVGSGPSSSWVIREDGVRPLHFSIHWDGEKLRIADTYGAGDVRADGEPVTAQWRSITGSVRVEFGQAVLMAELVHEPGVESARHEQPQAAPATLLEGIPVAAELDATATAPLDLLAERLVRPAADSAANEPEVADSVPAEAVLESAADQSTTAEVPASPPNDSASVPAVVVAPAATVAVEPPPSTRVQKQKATLIGVSPISVPGPANAPLSASATPSGVVPPVASTPSSEPEPSPFMPARPESDRPRKATLLGMAVTIPPDKTVPLATVSVPERAPPVATQVVEKVAEKEFAPRPSKNSMTGTLIGVANPVEFLRAAQQAKEALLAGAARNDVPGAVTQPEMRAVTEQEATPAVAGQERIGSTWQETAGSERTPPAVLLSSSVNANAVDPSQFQPHLDGYDRYGEGPSLRGAGYEPRDGRSFPWRYVGIGVLTAAAYFAWLYLLDHF